MDGAIAKRGDLLLYPATCSWVASTSAARDGTASSGSRTVWNVGVVTSVTRDGIAKAHRVYHRVGGDGPLYATESKGQIVGQIVGAADRLRPLAADDLARRFADADFASPEAARDAILAAIAAATGGEG